MKFSSIKYVLTDIEGTTTSVSFVYDVLFPYFRANIQELKNHLDEEEVQNAFKATVHLANKLEETRLHSVDEIMATLERWSKEDKKVTPLKSVQGVIWKKGYESGEIKGHVYDDVPGALENWKKAGLHLGVFSSGSVTAQKLIFGHSTAGDLTPYFSHYFDTNKGGKKEKETYTGIAEEINIDPMEILFLSDMNEELEAAQEAGLQTCQLWREGTERNWPAGTENFNEIELM